jgi:UDP-N-acetylmuramate dehydrogenase
LGTVDNATVQNTPVDAVIDGSPCEINLLNSYSAVYVKPEYGYRHCDFRGDLIVSVRFVLERGDRSAIGKRMDYVFSERLKRHPNEPSLGSVWKAVDSVPAAVYIEKLLLKGMRAGGVMLSPKHCNFIVNVGGGTSYDYIKLMEIVETVALEKLGVKLEREIRVLEE